MIRIQKYLLTQFIRNASLSLAIFVFLVLMFEFFDRIDKILEESSGILLTLEYFILRVPLIMSLMLPIAIMTGSLLTLGLLSKNSEITAMRATGMPISALLKPFLISGLIVSVAAFLLNETVVPAAQRRAKEVYNIDIRQKDKTGGYSQSNIWWRNGNTFYSIDNFDSRTETLHSLSALSLTQDFQVTRRVDAKSASWVRSGLGWTMKNVKEYHFLSDDAVEEKTFSAMPLPIPFEPSDFYDAKTDPHTMSFMELDDFIDQQKKNGLEIAGYLPFLYEKLSFPLFNFIVILLVSPFAIRSARSGGMAAAIVIAMAIGFSYFAVHSFSLALGRAELIPAVVSAWLANFVMLIIGTALVAGSEAPQ